MEPSITSTPTRQFLPRDTMLGCEEDGWVRLAEQSGYVIMHGIQDNKRLLEKVEVLQTDHKSDHVMQNHYEILGVQPASSKEEIQMQYFALRLKYVASTKTARQLQKVEDAYKVLGDDRKREECDRESKSSTASTFAEPVMAAQRSTTRAPKEEPKEEAKDDQKPRDTAQADSEPQAHCDRSESESAAAITFDQPATEKTANTTANATVTTAIATATNQPAMAAQRTRPAAATTFAQPAITMATPAITTDANQLDAAAQLTQSAATIASALPLIGKSADTTVNVFMEQEYKEEEIEEIQQMWQEMQRKRQRK